MIALDINRINRRGGLKEGASSPCPPGLPRGRKSDALVAGEGVLYWRDCRIEFVWEPIITRNRPASWGALGWRARPKFICDCGAGAYRLHLGADGRFACAKCAGYVRPSRQNQRDPYASILRRHAKAQAALGMTGLPVLADLPPPPRAPRSVWLYRRRAAKLRLIELALLGVSLENYLARRVPEAAA